MDKAKALNAHGNPALSPLFLPVDFTKARQYARSRERRRRGQDL